MVINKYVKWYSNIIENAKKRTNFCHKNYEKHHILPRSMGGSDEKENIVQLTLREHFVCHRLLTKFTIGEDKHKMICAVNRMMISKKYNVNSRVYENVRSSFIESLKENHPSKTEAWLEKVKNYVLESWKNDNERRYKTSLNMKKLWNEGKLKPKFGSENGMFGKVSVRRGKKFPGTGKSGESNPAAKEYNILTPNGDELKTKCLKTFCDEHNLNYGCMKKVSQGKNKQHRGYTIIGKEGHQ